MNINIKKVLIVEDDAIIALNLSIIVQRIGYEPVATIAKGGEVADAVKLYMPDIILMDILLNDKIDGITAAGRVNTFSDIPVIFITSNTQPEFVDKAIRENPFGYIIKPFRENEIKYAIMLADQKIAMIREIQKNQSEQKRLKDFYNDILGSMTDWVIVINSRSEILFSNDSFNKTFSDKNPNNAFQSFIADEFTDKSGLLNRVFSTGKKSQKEISIKNSTYSISVSPVFSEDKNISSAVMSGRDISELIEQRESLTIIRDVLNNVVQSVPTGIILTNSEGVVTLSNKTFESMSGFSSSDIEGKNISILLEQSSIKNLKMPDSTGSKKHNPIELEFQKADSNTFTAKTIILNFEKPINQNFKNIFFITDISFEKKLEIKQVRLQNHIESIVREMDDLSEMLLETNVYNQSIRGGDVEFDTTDRNILRLIESGMTNRQIASRLEIAEITVKKHLTGIYSKLGIINKYQLIEYLHKNFIPDK